MLSLLSLYAPSGLFRSKVASYRALLGYADARDFDGSVNYSSRRASAFVDDYVDDGYNRCY